MPNKSDITWHNEIRKLSDLIPVLYNPRKLSDKERKDLKKSLCKFNLAEIPVINTDNTILAGHQRCKILAEIENKDFEIDVRVPNRKLTKEESDEYLIRSNKNTGEFDFELLAENFEIDDLVEYGFDQEDFDFTEPEEIGEIEGQDDVPEAPGEPITKKGDLWVLGDHMLLCGDATSIDDVDKLMDLEKADLVFTDPPYGMKKENEGILNDNLNFNDLLEFNNQWIPLTFSSTKDNGSWYCWGIDQPLMDVYSEIIRPYIKNQKATFRNLITWDKGNGQGQNSELTRSYATADEKCLFVMMGVQGFNTNSDNYFEGWEPIRDYLLQSRIEMGWSVPDMKKIVGHSDLSRDHWTSKSQFSMPTREVYEKMKAEADRLREQTKNNAFKKEYDELKKEYLSTRAYFNNTHDNFNNVWHFNRHIKDGSEGGHATPKPINLCERAIKSSSREKEIILDVFGGSGSTLIACEKTKRRCFMMEIEPKYCDIIIKRWQEFTGNSAILQETGECYG